MAIPPTAAKFRDSLDPHEILEWVAPCSTLLESDEQIEEDYELAVLAEGAALGLTIMEGDDRDHKRTNENRDIELWLTIDDAFKGNAAFDGSGVNLPLEISFWTSSTPPRRRNRIFLIQVVQK